LKIYEISNGDNFNVALYYTNIPIIKIDEEKGRNINMFIKIINYFIARFSMDRLFETLF
jgi:hypothetical protein